jgi:hypothetical protein
MKSGLRILFLIFVSFFLFSFIGKKHKNDLAKMKLKGKVKMLVDSISDSKNTYYFNNHGFQIKEIMNFYDNTNCDWMLTTKYDKNNNIIEKKKTCLTTICYRLDPTGSGLNWCSIYTYDNSGNLKSEIHSDSELSNKTTFKYYPSHKKSEYSSYADHDYDERDSNVCDNNGNIIENFHFGFDEANRSTWKYDADGNVIQENFYNVYTDTAGTKIIYKYDSLGNEVEKNEINESLKQLYRKTISQYFDFDRQKNWHKKVESINDKLYQTTYRSIEYY